MKRVVAADAVARRHGEHLPVGRGEGVAIASISWARASADSACAAVNRFLPQPVASTLVSSTNKSGSLVRSDPARRARRADNPTGPSSSRLATMFVSTNSTPSVRPSAMAASIHSVVTGPPLSDRGRQIDRPALGRNQQALLQQYRAPPSSPSGDCAVRARATSCNSSGGFFTTRGGHAASPDGKRMGSQMLNRKRSARELVFAKHRRQFGQAARGCGRSRLIDIREPVPRQAALTGGWRRWRPRTTAPIRPSCAAGQVLRGPWSRR